MQTYLGYSHGQAMTPYELLMGFPDADSKVSEVLLAMRSSDGEVGGKYLADYANKTSWADLSASARGWTVALENDTTPVDDTANGSVGNVARVDGASANVGVMLRRVRLSRPDVDSLRGTSYVVLRANPGAGGVWELSPRWSPSLANPVSETGPTILLDGDVTGNWRYQDQELCFIRIPEDLRVGVGGVALEIWARRIAGVQNLRMDFVRFLPATPGKDVLTRIRVEGGSSEEVLGKDLQTPPYKLAADPTSVAGTNDGDVLVLNAVNEGGGVAPNTAVPWPVGRHEITFDWWSDWGNLTVKVRVVSVGGGGAGSVIVEYDRSITSGGAGVTKRTFDSVGGTGYQPQVVLTAYTSGDVRVNKISHKFVPAIVQNEQIRTDPLRGAVEKLEADGDLLIPLVTDGDVPFWVPQGLFVVVAVPTDIAPAFYTTGESVKGRTMTLAPTSAPRQHA